MPYTQKHPGTVYYRSPGVGLQELSMVFLGEVGYYFQMLILSYFFFCF